MRGTRDVYAILHKMVARGNWDQYFSALGRNERNWVSELFELRNESWAHQGIYTDEDIHHYLGVMLRLLRSVGAREQAASVNALHAAIGRLLYGQQPVTEAEGTKQIVLALPEGLGREDVADLLRQTILSISPQQNLSPATDSGTLVDSDSIELRDPEDAEGYIQRGQRNLENDNYDEAISDFCKAIELSPDESKPYRARGNAYVQNEEFDLALADFEMALEIEPDGVRNILALGGVYFQRGDVDTSIEFLGKAIQLDPGNDIAYRLRGIVLAEKGEYSLAISDLSEAIKLAPEELHTYHMRGSAYIDNGYQELAIADYLKAIQLDAGDVHSYRTLGTLYGRRSQYDLAVENLT